MNKSAYWETYIEYWQKRVKEANVCGDGALDKMPDDAIMERYIYWLNSHLTPPKGAVLDYGCGFGRAYPYFETLGVKYYGCDIANACIQATLTSYPQIPKQRVKKLKANECIPFRDNTFSGVFCYGVFDACNQALTLSEILRVLKIGGVALITGKNDTYLESDEMAMVAEIGARNNNHPNFFTNTQALLYALQSRNIAILESRFFLWRKDNATDTFTTTLPPKFYTYALLIQKAEDSILGAFESFSDSYSQNFKAIH